MFTKTKLPRRKFIAALLGLPSAGFAATWQKLDTEAGSGWRKLCLAAGSGGTWQKLGTCASLAYTTNLTISSHTTNYNLRAAALAAGWNGTAPLVVTVTINSGGYVYSTSTGAYAFDTGSGFPAGSQLTLVNNGVILGCGGGGGMGGYYVDGLPGAAGGPAFIARYALRVTNNGSNMGGGGGGGGGGTG